MPAISAHHSRKPTLSIDSFVVSGLELDKTETDSEGIVNTAHGFGAEGSEEFDETAFVNGADLVEKRGGLGFETSFGRSDKHVGGVGRILELRGEGGHDGDGAVAVGGVVLQDQS